MQLSANACRPSCHSKLQIDRFITRATQIPLDALLVCIIRCHGRSRRGPEIEKKIMQAWKIGKRTTIRIVLTDKTPGLLIMNPDYASVLCIIIIIEHANVGTFEFLSAIFQRTAFCMKVRITST